ncbi:MAG TPA: FAD-dependent oxidoreductase, partial [Solirubrobacteraceae bacterium]|nr:FAD-dependent oxidoreductase [Solirubrobacteraceae bacterium]
MQHERTAAAGLAPAAALRGDGAAQDEPIVVVGASLAGLKAAEAIRAGGHTGSLTLVGDEPHRPYERPPLSKGVLGGADPAQAALPCDTLDATWELGVRASGLDAAAREVRLEDGRVLPYAGLVLATGTRAREWPAPVPAGVLTIRGLDDALAVRGALAPGRRLVVVGAGFLGCEVAATAAALGVDVTLIDVAETPMAVLGPDVGALYHALHAGRGIR